MEGSPSGIKLANGYIGFQEPQNGNGHNIGQHSFVGPDRMEPIAVIGLSLKFPQEAVSSDTFWQLLTEGRSAMTEVPPDRFKLDSPKTCGAIQEYESQSEEQLNVRGGHFLHEDIAAFDAPFFSINSMEASCMDPQQRGLLECAYRALENAGVLLTDLAGSKTSVHVGSFSHEYETILLRDPELQGKYMATVGPSVALDTACSGSLLALHLACQSPRGGESKLGLVAGCNLFYNPDLMIPMTNLNFLSPDSKCYSFDHRANGYSRGEGFGVVVIEPLANALRDGNTIRAVIRATGSNQDGRTPGITQPSSVAQEALIRETYEAGGLDLKTTRYFEAHGTGTPVGDPLEAKAIGSVFGSQRSPDEPIYIGALKSNIGHLEGASGIAGLIKSILVLERGIIPPNIWFEQPNPKILVDDWNIKFPLELTPWPSEGLRRASVNSFGYGGSNVHVVLDDSRHYLALRNLDGIHCTVKKSSKFDDPVHPQKHLQYLLQQNGTDGCPPIGSLEDRKPRLLVLSASDEGGLRRLANVYHAHLANVPDSTSTYNPAYFEDLVYTVCTKRSSLPWKSFVTANSTEDLSQSLGNRLSKPIRSGRVPRLAFVFTGQGAQWAGMGRELMMYPTFRHSLQKAGEFYKSLGWKWSVLDELTKEEENSNIDSAECSQLLCTALQVALIDLLRSWGMHPSAVVGHSSGEIAAAYSTDSVSRESAWKIAYFRGVYSNEVAVRAQTPGAMMAVGLPEAGILPFFAGLKRKCGKLNITVGCINSQSSITLTGNEEQIDILKTTLDKHQIFAWKLKVRVAYHSSYMSEVALEFDRSLSGIVSGSLSQSLPEISMFSTVSSERIHSDRLQESSYWVKNLLSPVRFLEAFTSMCSESTDEHLRKSEIGQQPDTEIDQILEIGPHSGLQGPIKNILKSLGKHERVGYSSLLTRNVCALETTLIAIGRLCCLGYPIDLKAVDLLTIPRTPRMLINLPEYPFNHSQTYWLESKFSKDFRFRQRPPHELLGTTARDWNPLEPPWRHIIREAENPWVKHHKVNGITLYPASGILVMAIEAVRQLAGSEHVIRGYRLKEVTFLRALQIHEDQVTETTLSLRPHRGGEKTFVWHEFSLCSYENDKWVENCRGSVAVEYDNNQCEFSDETNAENELLGRKIYADGRLRCKTLVNSKELNRII